MVLSAVRRGGLVFKSACRGTAPHNRVALGVGGRELVALSLGCRSCRILMNEQDTSSFADRRGVGAVIISVMLTISIVASIYICFVAR